MYARPTTSETLEFLLPKLLDVIDRHQEGTDFGIGVDPSDGLLRQGAEGYQLTTWMDLEVDDWVVQHPAAVRAVEINTLWYNALRVAAGWLEKEGDARRAKRLCRRVAVGCRFGGIRELLTRSADRGDQGYTSDIVDKEGGGNDPALRPNQRCSVFLCRMRFLPKISGRPLSALYTRVLTPVGLRSLAPLVIPTTSSL